MYPKQKNKKNSNKDKCKLSTQCNSVVAQGTRNIAYTQSFTKYLQTTPPAQSQFLIHPFRNKVCSGNGSNKPPFWLSGQLFLCYQCSWPERCILLSFWYENNMSCSVCLIAVLRYVRTAAIPHRQNSQSCRLTSLWQAIPVSIIRICSAQSFGTGGLPLGAPFDASPVGSVGHLSPWLARISACPIWYSSCGIRKKEKEKEEKSPTSFLKTRKTFKVMPEKNVKKHVFVAFHITWKCIH